MEEAINLPLVCGMCNKGYTEFMDFYQHIKCHDNTLTNHIHVCNFENTDVNKGATCRCCSKTFTCMCTLHDHLSTALADPSYFYFSERNVAYPVSSGGFSYNHTSNITAAERNCVDKFNTTLTNLLSDIKDLIRSDDVYAEIVSQNVDKAGPPESNTEYSHQNDEDKADKKLKTQKAKRVKTQLSSEGQQYSRRLYKIKVNLNQNKGKNKKSKSKLADNIGETLLREQSVTKEKANIENNVDISLQIVNSNENAIPKETCIDQPVGDKQNSCKPPGYKQEAQVLEIRPAPAKGKPGRRKSDLETCNICGKRVKRSKMKVHSISHTSDRPFMCEKCPKTYKYPDHLALHVKSHDQVLPYYCDVCGHGFVDCNRLKRHMIMHTDKRPFMCEICSAGFVTKYKLQRHMQVHTRVKKMQCDLCGVQFANKETLGQHIALVHKQERRFSCQECDRTFFTNYQLRCHVMKHSGVRPHKCSRCKSDFVEKKELRRHMKRQHNLDLNGEPAPNTHDIGVRGEPAHNTNDKGVRGEPATIPNTHDVGERREPAPNTHDEMDVREEPSSASQLGTGHDRKERLNKHDTQPSATHQQTSGLPGVAVGQSFPPIQDGPSLPLYKNMPTEYPAETEEGKLLFHNLLASTQQKLLAPDSSHSYIDRSPGQRALQNSEHLQSTVDNSRNIVSGPIMSSMVISPSTVGERLQMLPHSDVRIQTLSGQPKPAQYLVPSGFSDVTKDILLLGSCSTSDDLKMPPYMPVCVKDSQISVHDRVYGPVDPRQDIVCENIPINQGQPQSKFVMMNPVQQGDFTVL